MLHYFAKKFFHAKILSAYIEGDDICLYYVNDDIHWQMRQFASRESEQLRSGSLLHVSHPVSVLESHMKQSAHTSGQRLHQTSAVDDVDDKTVHLKQTVDNSSPSRHTQDDCTVILQCFQWNSFEPRAMWNVTFPQVCMLIIYCTLLHA